MSPTPKPRLNASEGGPEMPTELPRVTITLAPAEWDALELYAAARGLRPSEVARGAVVAMLADPALAEAPSPQNS